MLQPTGCCLTVPPDFQPKRATFSAKNVSVKKISSAIGLASFFLVLSFLSTEHAKEQFKRLPCTWVFLANAQFCLSSQDEKYFTNSKPFPPPPFFWKIYHGNHWIVTVEYVQFNLDCCFSSFNSDRKTLSSSQKYRAVEALSFSWLRSVSKLGDYNLASPWLNLLLVRKLWKLF